MSLAGCPNAGKHIVEFRNGPGEQMVFSFPQALLDGFSVGAGEQKGFPIGKIVFGPETLYKRAHKRARSKKVIKTQAQIPTIKNL